MTEQPSIVSSKPTTNGAPKSKPGASGTSPKSKSDPHTIMAVLRDPQTLSRISYFLSQKGIPTTHPCLRIEVDTISDQQTLELEADDVQKLFASFGPVESVIVSPTHKNSATVVFKDIISAYFAQQSLHLHHLPAYQARLSVKWNIVEDPRLVLTSDPSISRGHLGLGSAFNSQPVSESEYAAEPAIGTANNYKDRNGNPANGSTSKYTCRFEIQIENDKEFQVARRLIGAKGCHMKKILDTCSKGCSGPVQEVVKLRLRGKGSGFKEGPNQQESDEPLHLCISSPYQDKYLTACEMAKELITGIYEEYRIFCEKTGRPKSLLQIKMIENVNPPTMRGPRPPTYSKADHAGGYYPPAAAVATAPRGMPPGYYCGGRPVGPYYYPPGYPPAPYYGKYDPYGEGYHYPPAGTTQGYYVERGGEEKEKGGYYANPTHQQP